MSRKDGYKPKHKKDSWFNEPSPTDLVHSCDKEGHRWVNNDSDKSRCCLGCGMVEYR